MEEEEREEEEEEVGGFISVWSCFSSLSHLLVSTEQNGGIRFSNVLY